MTYQGRLSEEQWLSLKAAIEEVGADGPFDASAAGRRFLETEWARGNIKLGEPIINAADIPMVLDDMVDLGYLRSLGGNPPLWELAE